MTLACWHKTSQYNWPLVNLTHKHTTIKAQPFLSYSSPRFLIKNIDNFRSSTVFHKFKHIKISISFNYPISLKILIEFSCGYPYKSKLNAFLKRDEPRQSQRLNQAKLDSNSINTSVCNEWDQLTVFWDPPKPSSAPSSVAHSLSCRLWLSPLHCCCCWFWWSPHGNFDLYEYPQLKDPISKMMGSSAAIGAHFYQ